MDYHRHFTANSKKHDFESLLERVQKTGLHRLPRVAGLLTILQVNPDDIEVREILVESVEAEEMKQRLTPNPFSATNPINQNDLSGDIILGSIPPRGVTWRIPSELLTNSILISGRAGGGKTNLMLLLMMQVLTKLNVIVFDRKSDYPALSIYPNFSYLLLEHTYYNILEPPPGLSFQQWLSIVAEIISNFFDIRIAARTLITTAGLRLHYMNLKRGSQLYPTLKDIYFYIKKITYPAISHHARHQETAINRFESILSTFGDHVCSHRQVNWHKFFNSSWAISIDGIPTDLQNFYITVTVARILLYRMANNLRSSGLATLLAFDEASTIFRRWHETREGTPLLLDYMAKAREFGLGFLISSQSLSGMADSVLANTAIKILAGGFGLGTDYDIFASATGLNAQQKDFLKRITMPGMACAKEPRYPYAFLLEVPRVVQ